MSYANSKHKQSRKATLFRGRCCDGCPRFRTCDDFDGKVYLRQCSYPKPKKEKIEGKP
jgi:hypothetical protein